MDWAIFPYNRPKEGAEERLKTEDEVEGELLWRFSPHNPDRKHHSSFERVSSAAMSSSDELGDSPEDISRGLDSRVIGDSSMSMEKDDRMGIAASAESKEAHSSTKNKASSQDTRMDSSKIPGEKKKKNSNKSLTAKLTSYFTSWLPDVSFAKDPKEDSVSKEVDSEDMKRTGKSMNDEDHVGINSNWPLSTDDFLAHLPELLKRFPVKRARQGKADGAASTDSDDDDGVVRDDAVCSQSRNNLYQSLFFIIFISNEKFVIFRYPTITWCSSCIGARRGYLPHCC